MNLGVSSLAQISTIRSSVDAGNSFSSPTQRLPTKKQQLLMLITPAVRFGTPVLIMVLLIVMVASQAPNRESFLPVVDIDTSTMDMFSGMYSALGDSFTDSDNLGLGLSTSAILIMSNLTSILMGSLPDHTSSSFTTTCFHTTYHYRYDDDHAPHPDDVTLILPYGVNQGNYNFTNTTVECQKTTLFDYRAILYDNGFYYMLSFADKDPVSDQDYDKYQSNIDKKNSMISKVPSMLIFVLVAQIVSLGVAFCHRLIVKKNDASAIVRILDHGMAIWTLVIFIVDAGATISLTKVFIEIKTMARNDFQTFGVTIRLSLPWFTLLWLVLACCIVEMFGWVGPVWCSAPDEEEFEAESSSLLTTEERINPFDSRRDDPFVGPFDSPLGSRRASTSTRNTPEMGYDYEFAASPIYTKEDEDRIRYSKIRPIL